MRYALGFVIAALVVSGCAVWTNGSTLFENQSTICKQTGFSYGKADITCYDKSSGAAMCSYSMGTDRDGHLNSSAYDCRQDGK